MIARLLISRNLPQRKNAAAKILSGYIKEENLNHPDLLYFKSEEKLGIEQARKIKTHLSLKPYSAKGRVVILENASGLTSDAQNALLKILEEPPLNAVLILTADSDSSFLPTLLSRCRIIYLEDSSNPDNTSAEEEFNDIEKLIQSSSEVKFEYIEKLKNKDEFLSSLIRYFHKRLPLDVEFSKELLQAEQWRKSNVNIRAILEYLMLVMPTKV